MSWMDRRGRFYLGKWFIKKYPSLARRIMGKCIIYRAEFMFDRDEFEYLAYSKHFREADPGEMAPEYEIQISGTKLKFIEKE